MVEALFRDEIFTSLNNLGQDLTTSLENYSRGFFQAKASGSSLAVPRVAELIADSSFRSLDDWLQERQIDIGDIQIQVDQFLERAGRFGPSKAANRSLD